jgi:hypothetical protein
MGTPLIFSEKWQCWLGIISGLPLALLSLALVLKLPDLWQPLGTLAGCFAGLTIIGILDLKELD